jgi:hypothetical protein
MNITAKVASALLITLLLAACGGGISGTYTGKQSLATITFSSGKADIKVMGATIEMNYSVDGDKVKLLGPGGSNMVLTRNKDGSLDTPWGHLEPRH